MKSRSDESQDDVLLDFKELFEVILKRKVWLVVCTGLGAVFSVFYSLSIPNTYSSETLLASKNNTQDRLSEIAGSYAGLAQMAGISLGSDVGNDDYYILATMNSREFFKKYFFTDVDLMIELLAVTEWDSETNSYSYNESIRNQLLEASNDGVGFGEAGFALNEAYRNFRGKYSVNQQQYSNFVLVSIQHLSPFVAQKWVERIVSSIDSEIRNRDIKKAESSIKFLNEQLGKNSLVSLNSVFGRLIEDQTRTLMLAYADSDYVFDMIEPPIVNIVKVSPKRAVICMWITGLSFLFSLFLILCQHAYIKNKSTSQ
ncbi:MAG: hypothetical protein CMK56_01850 [Proteobacteria bacterium]|nr:hypothetical protein [Pseudomonadota bacterium]